MTRLRTLIGFLVVLSGIGSAYAEPPSISYIFPAGGRRGTTVDVRIGGHFLHEKARLELSGAGVSLLTEGRMSAEGEIVQTERIWFEGPLIRQPASQQREDYPLDYAARFAVAADAPLGPRRGRVMTGQGASESLPWIVGDLPELVEEEIEGEPIPTRVSTPLTINGRIFPREDVDVWEFEATVGQTITCGVVAAELGSPLEPRLEVCDPSGHVIAESAGGLRPDPQLRFTTANSGTYSVRVSDSRYSGGQAFVYRLTISGEPWIDAIYPLGGRRGQEITFETLGQAIPDNRITARLPDEAPGIVRLFPEIAGRQRNGVFCDLDDLEEHLEPPDAPPPTLLPPAVANGRIARAGEVDGWAFSASQGKPLWIELRAARLGSPLDGVLVIRDAMGKELARAEDLPTGSPDCELEFTPPANGMYTVEVSERFASRGGPAFAYRLRMKPASPDFQLALGTEVLIAEIGGEKKLPVEVRRLGGLQAPVRVAVDGLPAGISAAEITIGPNQTKGELVWRLDKQVPVQWIRPRITGRAELAGQSMERDVVLKLAGGESRAERLLVACALPTPFRFHADYQLRYIPRGGRLKKTFQIDRQGFLGPLEARLADRQGRHLQGVSGTTIHIPADQNEFEYEVYLPPWMELGRTSRSNLMLVGEQTDSSGRVYKVSFSTNEQNEQLIAITSPAPLRLSLERAQMTASARGELRVPVRIHRDRQLAGACRLELIVPRHMQSIEADPVVVPASGETGELRLRFGEQPGPCNRPC